MNESAPRSVSTIPVQFDPDAVCERCGRFGAYRFAERALCEECYSGCGSCCPEFGRDDLWQKRDDPTD